MQPTNRATVWSRNAYSLWVVERSYPVSFLKTLELPDRPGVIKMHNDRFYSWLPEGVDANDGWISCQSCRTLNPFEDHICQGCGDLIQPEMDWS